MVGQFHPTWKPDYILFDLDWDMLQALLVEDIRRDSRRDYEQAKIQAYFVAMVSNNQELPEWIDPTGRQQWSNAGSDRDNIWGQEVKIDPRQRNKDMALWNAAQSLKQRKAHLFK